MMFPTQYVDVVRVPAENAERAQQKTECIAKTALAMAYRDLAVPLSFDQTCEVTEESPGFFKVTRTFNVSITQPVEA